MRLREISDFAKFTKLFSSRDVSGKAFLTSKMEFFFLSHCDFEMHIEIYVEYSFSGHINTYHYLSVFAFRCLTCILLPTTPWSAVFGQTQPKTLAPLELVSKQAEGLRRLIKCWLCPIYNSPAENLLCRSEAWGFQKWKRNRARYAIEKGKETCVVTPGVLLRTQPGLAWKWNCDLKVKVIVIVNNDEKIDIRDS